MNSLFNGSLAYSPSLLSAEKLSHLNGFLSVQTAIRVLLRHNKTILYYVNNNIFLNFLLLSLRTCQVYQLLQREMSQDNLILLFETGCTHQEGPERGFLLHQFFAKSFSCSLWSGTGDKRKVAGELHLGARWQTSLDCNEARQFAENDAWIIGPEWQVTSWIMHRMDNSAAHCIESVSNTYRRHECASQHLSWVTWHITYLHYQHHDE